MKRNLKIVASYRGTDFFGWEESREGPTVEGELKKALSRIVQQKVQLNAASRTDRGVHAENQVINFFTESKLEEQKILKGANALLPKAIRILSIEEMAPSFHATLDSRGKCYRYEIDNRKAGCPFRKDLHWHLPGPLDREKMEQSLAAFVGKKDFSSFGNRLKGGPERSPICHISSLTLTMSSESLILHIMGDHFLYKMVRNIVGTIVGVGQGKIDLSELDKLFSGKRREEAGVTAPAHGLFLEKVFYPEAE